MSEVTLAKMDYYHPRTIWVLGLQLFYTLLAMIPVYYYLNEIHEIRAEGKYFVIYLPILVGIILFLLELYLNGYFWFTEKIYKKRDVLVAAGKSLILVLFLFYTLFLLIFGYWFSDTETYQRIVYQSEISQLMAEVIISLGLIYFIIIMMINIQNQRFEQIFKRKFSRN